MVTKKNDRRRIHQVASRLIRYPRFKELHAEISDCQLLSKMGAEPQCMSLEGRTGAGKSTLVKDYAAAFGRIETEEGTEIPVFYMQTPSPVTVKGMAAAMLEQLGDPAAHRGTLAAMNSRLINLIIACKVEVVILDDFQHLIDPDRNRILRKVSDWLKYVIKETGVPFLVVGIEGEVVRILQANAQLSRLFAFRETLRPFIWDLTGNKEATKEFVHFMHYACEAIEVPLTRDLQRLELLQRIHYATDGVVGHIMNLMRYAALIAHKQDKNELTLAILEQAFAKRLAEHMSKKKNPFAQSVGTTFSAPGYKALNQPEATSNRKGGKKGRRPRASEILKK